MITTAALVVFVGLIFFGLFVIYQIAKADTWKD